MLKFFLRKQRRIYNVTNDEKGEYNQEHNVVTLKDMKWVMHTCNPSNSKKMCITLI